MVIAFHPELNLPRLFIYRSYDQNKTDLTSLHHFEVIQRNFFNYSENFNLKTLKQLQDAALAVENKKENTSLAEMFSIELKLTTDCLKFWFDRSLKKMNLMKMKEINLSKTHLKKHAAFVIFQLKVEQ